MARRIYEVGVKKCNRVRVSRVGRAAHMWRTARATEKKAKVAPELPSISGINWRTIRMEENYGKDKGATWGTNPQNKKRKKEKGIVGRGLTQLALKGELSRAHCLRKAAFRKPRAAVRTPRRESP